MLQPLLGREEQRLERLGRRRPRSAHRTGCWRAGRCRCGRCGSGRTFPGIRLGPSADLSLPAGPEPVRPRHSAPGARAAASSGSASKQPLRLAPRLLDQANVGQACHAQLGEAGLARAQEIARAALLADRAPPAGIRRRWPPWPSGVRCWLRPRCREAAGSRRRTPLRPTRPAELVELRQAEAVGALDHHHRRIRDVHAHLDHGGRDQDVPARPARKRLHDLVLLVRAHPAVEQAHLAASGTPRPAAGAVLRRPPWLRSSRTLRPGGR